MVLKDLVRNYAYELGADLVGFGDIGRCRHAPLMMSPQGLMPTARSVIVMALHHPDACIERGGENHPQDIGPYTVQYLMNSKLDEMSYRMATFLERQGCGALPIVSSNIWRYNEYKDLKAVFAPDVSHIYMAVVAGLADMGFSGLALTPEFGARNRFITVITDADIEPDPLIPPGTVCDGCMLCRKHCPSQALSKEIDGEKVLKIDQYEYKFANKNLWRCAWGEHFDLDVDLPIPDVVTEEVILKNVAEHGFRGGEMGQCLKFCVPKALREFDPNYSRTPVRKIPVAPDESLEGRGAVDKLLSSMMAGGLDELVVTSAEDLKRAAIDVEAILPGTESAVTLIVTPPPAGNDTTFRSAAQHQVDCLCYDLTRRLEEMGHRSIMTIKRDNNMADPRENNPTSAIIKMLGRSADGALMANTVLTRKKVAPQKRGGTWQRKTVDYGNQAAGLTSHLGELARTLGADLVGVAPAGRLDELVPQLRPLFEVERLDATDRSVRFTPWSPEVDASRRKLKTPGDWLPQARSVFVFAVRYHREVLRWATRPPAEAVGPYSYETYFTSSLGGIIGWRLVKELERFGHRGVITMDLTGAGSTTANPRTERPDIFSNRFAALAAGLGYLTTSGHVATAEFGLRQRFIAVVTDAALEGSPLCSPQEISCDSCEEMCITSCPSKAIGQENASISCEGVSWSFNKIDAVRCDWVKRYALMADSGYGYLGSKVDIAPPEVITAEALTDALKQLDPIKKYRPVVAEPCVLNCPLAVQE